MRPITLVIAATMALSWQLPAFGQTALESELRDLKKRMQYLEKRIADHGKVIADKDKEINELKEGGEAWYDSIVISGGVELEASYSDPFEGSSESDAVVSEVVLGIAAQPHEWVGGEVSLLYEEDDTDLEIDTASITVADPDGPWMVQGGQIYVPFGTFETHLISDPLTLELGETRETTVLGGVSVNGFSGSVYAFNGDNNEDGDNHIDSFGATIGYAMETEDMTVAVNLGFINNLGDSDTLQDVINDNLGSNDVDDYTAGWTASALFNYAGFTVIGEYLGALDDFDAAEVPWGTEGAEPKTWNVEAAYGFTIAGKDATVAVAYQGSDEAIALELPETRVLAGISVDVVDHVSIAFEWAHDYDYDEDDGGTGKEADTLTAQIALEL